MPEKFGAGKLVERVAFDRRCAVDDGFGNETSGDWVEQFQIQAAFIFMRGSETIVNGRLQNRAAMIVRVRACALTKDVDVEWQMRDVRRGTTYNIRDITNDNSRAVLDLLCESKVNTG